MNRKKKRWVRRVVWLIVLALIGLGVWFIALPMLRQSVTVTYDTYTATTAHNCADIGNVSCLTKRTNNIGEIFSGVKCADF